MLGKLSISPSIFTSVPLVILQYLYEDVALLSVFLIVFNNNEDIEQWNLYRENTLGIAPTRSSLSLKELIVVKVECGNFLSFK